MQIKEDINNVPSGTTSLNNGHGAGNQQSNVLRSPAAESNEEIIKRVRAGWTRENANAVTVGELYLMVSKGISMWILVVCGSIYTTRHLYFFQFGADSKVKMEYWWEERESPAGKESSSATLTEGNSQQDLINSPPQKEPNNQLSQTLQKLLSITKMYSSQSKVS